MPVFNQSVFNQYARYYDLMYQDKDYKSEAGFIKGLLDQHAPHSPGILELGCGSGSHALCLCEMGYTLHGIDKSKKMLSLAKAKTSKLPVPALSRLSWRQADICHVQLNQQYDAVLSLFHVMNYQIGDEDIANLFKTVDGHLKSGGIFIFDCWNGPAVLHQPPEIRVKHAENDALLVTRICEPKLYPDRKIVDVHYTFFVKNKKSKVITRFCETHRMRYLFTPEIENFIKNTDMSIVEAGEWMTREPPSRDSFSIYYIAKKSKSSLTVNPG
jgi:SAM-dependent methyltransferase